MKIVFISMTGNVKEFVDTLDQEYFDSVLDLVNEDYMKEINENFVLIVPTYNDDVTDVAYDFLNYKDNFKNMIGVAGSGNLNFDELYVFTAKDISKKYDVPLVHHFEYFGMPGDQEYFTKEVKRIAST